MPEREQTRDLLLIILTVAAGLVDAVSYLGMGQIFTANMTGNIVFLALGVGSRELLTSLRSVDALFGFALGAFLGGRILGSEREPGVWRPRITWVLTGELAVMGGFAAGWALSGGSPSGNVLYLLIAVSAFGMGLQNAVAWHISVPGLTTTVVTSAMTGLMAQVAALGISGPAQRRAAAAIIALFSGAALGAAVLLYAPAVPPFLTVAVLGIVVALAFRSFGR